MKYTPAEFARKGLALLKDISYKFEGHRYSLAEFEKLVQTYNIQINRLLQQRIDLQGKEYTLKNLHYFATGSGISILIVILSIILYESRYGTYFSWQESILITVLCGIGGGFGVMYFWGPKDLSPLEKKNEALRQLYVDPGSLKKNFDTIVNTYRKRSFSFKKSQAKISTIRPRVSPALRSNTPRSRKMFKSSALAYEREELERRKGVLSLRFLMKISNLRSKQQKKTLEELKEVKLLVIDSDEEVTEALSELLKDECTLVIENSAVEGIKKALSEKPDLILLDRALPEKSGYDVCLELKENPLTQSIPMVMFIERAEREDVIQAKKAGADDYIVKQFDQDRHLVNKKEDLIELLERVLMGERHYNIQKILAKNITQAPSSEENMEKQHLRPRILIIKKKDLMDFELKEELKQQNYEVLLFHDANEIFSTINTEKPDLIVLDDEIQDINSYNICRMLNIRDQNTPVAMLMRQDMEYQAQKLILAGQLIKPFQYREIIQLVDDILVHHSKISQKEWVW